MFIIYNFSLLEDILYKVTDIFEDDIDVDLEKTDLMDLDEFLSVHEGKSSEKKKNSGKHRHTSDLLSDLLQTVHRNLGIPRGDQPSAFRLPKETKEKSSTQLSPNSKLSEKDNHPLADHEYINKDCKLEYSSDYEDSEGSSVKACDDYEEEIGTQEVKARRRKQRTYKYNPKPVQHKSDRKFVPDAQKDPDYWEKRRRNNLAAKKSREDRRRKELEVLNKLSALERHNEELTAQVKALQKKNEMLEKSLQEAMKKQN